MWSFDVTFVVSLNKLLNKELGLLVIWNAMMLMWHHCDDFVQAPMCWWQRTMKEWFPYLVNPNLIIHKAVLLTYVSYTKLKEVERGYIGFTLSIHLFTCPLCLLCNSFHMLRIHFKLGTYDTHGQKLCSIFHFKFQNLNFWQIWLSPISMWWQCWS